MGIKAIIDLLGGGLVKQVGSILDDVITSKEERVEVETKLTEAINKSLQESEQQLTDRHANDMKSDNWLAKSVRPATLVFIIAFTAMMAITDGNIGDITIKSNYVSVIEGWGSLVFAFYFGSRGVEKVFTTINKKK